MRKGFTIIECLISILLLAIVMVGGMAFYFDSTGHLAGATHKRIAAELANAKLEELKNIGYGNLTNGETSTSLNITAGINGLQNVTIVGTAYKEVSVQMFWNEPNKAGTQNVTISTYIAPR